MSKKQYAPYRDDVIRRAWRWRHAKNVLDAIALGGGDAIAAYCEVYGVTPVYDASGELVYADTVIALARAAQGALLREDEN